MDYWESPEWLEKSREFQAWAARTPDVPWLYVNGSVEYRLPARWAGTSNRIIHLPAKLP